jgi:hypothetical protein
MLAFLLMEQGEEGEEGGRSVLYIEVEFQDWNLLSSCRVDLSFYPLPSLMWPGTPCSGGLYLANSGEAVPKAKHSSFVYKTTLYQLHENGYNSVYNVSGYGLGDRNSISGRSVVC